MTKLCATALALLVVSMAVPAYAEAPASVEGVAWLERERDWARFERSATYRDPAIARNLSLTGGILLQPLAGAGYGHFYNGEVGRGLAFGLGQPAAAIGAGALGFAAIMAMAPPGIRNDTNPTNLVFFGLMAGLYGVCAALAADFAVLGWAVRDVDERVRQLNEARFEAFKQESPPPLRP